MASTGRARRIRACPPSPAPSPAPPGVVLGSLPSRQQTAPLPAAIRMQSAGGPRWLATRARNECLGNEHRIFAPANSLACVNLKPSELVMRPYWKGYLKLALVSCPIALHAACSSAERIALRQVNKATGNRLRQQLID